MASRNVGSLDYPIGTCRVQLGAIETESKRPTASFVPTGFPSGIYVSEAVLRSQGIVSIVVVACAGGQAVGVDVTRGEANRDNWLCGMDGLREEVVGERDGADGVEHWAPQRRGGMLSWVEVWRCGCMDVVVGSA